MENAFTGLYDENNKPIRFGDSIRIDLRNATETAEEYCMIVGKHPSLHSPIIRTVLRVRDDRIAFGVLVEQERGCLTWELDKNDPIAHGVTIVE